MQQTLPVRFQRSNPHVSVSVYLFGKIFRNATLFYRASAHRHCTALNCATTGDKEEGHPLLISKNDHQPLLIYFACGTLVELRPYFLRGDK